MAHVELSLSESFTPPTCDPDGPVSSSGDGATPSGDAPAGPLRRWAAAVAHASEPCLVIDGAARIVAASPSCHSLLGIEPTIGRYILDGVLPLVDFTAAREQLTEVETEKIPPLLALSSGRLARGLMRVHDGGAFDITVDAIATPLSDGETVVGALTFFSPI